MAAANPKAEGHEMARAAEERKVATRVAVERTKYKNIIEWEDTKRIMKMIITDQQKRMRRFTVQDERVTSIIAEFLLEYPQLLEKVKHL